jgi:hypothetical protein
VTQPDVALTDFALALECAILALRFPRRRVPDFTQRCGFRMLFAAAGATALVGGFFHGYLLDATSRVQNATWLVIFTAAGVASLACWGIAWAALLRGRGRLRDANLVGGVLFLLYLASALAKIQSFVSVLVATSVAGTLLLAAYWSAYRRRHPFALTGMVGVLLVFVGSLVQRSGFHVHPRFTADALYHVILAVALFLIYASAPAVMVSHPRTTDDVKTGRARLAAP